MVEVYFDKPTPAVYELEQIMKWLTPLPTLRHLLRHQFPGSSIVDEFKPQQFFSFANQAVIPYR